MEIQPCVTEVVGVHWGDEGKGRISSKESEDAVLVLRTTGGNNAGHTVYWEGDKIPLHLVPGGIMYPQTTAIICNGVVVNAEVLIQEIEMLSKYIDITPDKLILSDRAHMIMPYLIDKDVYQEKLRGKKSIGTTKRGIGPAYEDLAARIGIRFQELFLPKKELKKRLKSLLKFHKHELKKTNIKYTVDELYKYCKKAKKALKGYIKNPDELIAEKLRNGEKIVIEGAQADHLDVLVGDYPNCTSSQCNPSGTLSGAGLGPMFTKKVIGVIKAYCSRVGNGSFPTELFGDEGDLIREEGHEYGTTTGRPRRCGWLDLVAISPLRGYTDFCLNHLDTIGIIGNKLGYIKICTGYTYKGKFTRTFPSDLEISKENPVPHYHIFEGGWEIPKGCSSYVQLPKKAQEFVEFIEEYTKVPVTYIGIGPNNEDTIIREERYEAA